MKLHQIEYFLAVEKYHSFSQAALEINISQSTLSQQIALLENELGVHLFVRNKRHVYLTRAGQDFLINAQRIMLEVQKAQESMQQYSTLNKGFLRLGVLPCLIHSDIYHIVTKFLSAHKNIEIKLHIDTTDNLLEEMRSKKIHLAFVNSPFSSDFEVNFYPIIDEQIVAFIPASHPLAQKSVLEFADLQDENLFRLKLNSTIAKSIDEALKKGNADSKTVLESDNVDLIRSFVEAGIGISLMGNKLAESLLSPKTVMIPFSTMITLQSGLAVPTALTTGSTMPIVTKILRDFTLKEIAK